MAYLLDANVLMEPHRHYYAFDLCPGYWDFLDQAFAAGRIRSIQAVLTECQENADALSAWASARPAFFPPQTAATAIGMSRVSRWVMAHANYTPAAKAAFLGDADAILIAEALGGGHTVVTYETREPNRQVKVKIPDVCDALHVPCLRLPDALRAAGAKFTL
jgi:hypothetical protein